MLSLTRRDGESVKIGENITVYVTHIKGKSVRLSIDAPKEVRIIRTEIEGKEKK